MCGIVGFTDIKSNNTKREILEQMNSCIVHRGPDDDGFYLNEKIALGNAAAFDH